MKISQAIRFLQSLLEKHGDVELYFDCPKCTLAFTPTIVKAEAVIVSGVDKP